ncbi:helix-turn-helix domain-containing protein [Paenibacillus sp. GCM10027626]|uniref:helix-turn-helix domain-containing protein n=1 Tax=Paenibacillus sp. GCM10027626 TaxID=3273411 RepID=UPI0036359B67
MNEFIDERNRRGWFENIRGHLPQLVMCGDFTIRGGWELGPRTNDDYEIVYFPAGSATIYIAEDTPYELADACFIFTPRDTEHTYRFAAGKPVRHLFAHFTWPEEASAACKPIAPVTLLTAAPQIDPMIRHLIGLAGEMPPGWPERAAAILFSLLLELNGASAGGTSQKISATNAVSPAGKSALPAPMARQDIPIQIAHSLQYIEEHLPQQLTVKELAELAGWTHEYFTRTFVRLKGLSPKRYMLQRRIERACDLLRYQTSSVKEIAYLAGFQSEQYFSRAFVKITGMSPAKFRERHMDLRLYNLHLAPPADMMTSYPLNRYFFGANTANAEPAGNAGEV